MSIAKLTARIVQHLARLKRPVVKKLQPGVDVTARVDIALPRDLVQFYAVHDGTPIKRGDTLDDAHVMPGFYWLTIDDAAKAYARKQKARDWKASWWPVLANDGGDYYAVDCDSGQIIGYLKGEPEQHAEYDSLETMLRTIEHAFDERVIKVKAGCLEMDDDAYAKLALALNPKVDHWRREVEANDEGAADCRVSARLATAGF